MTSRVERELGFGNRTKDTLLIGLTEGDIQWDPAHGDFDPDASNALPAPVHEYVVSALVVDASTHITGARCCHEFEIVVGSPFGMREPRISAALRSAAATHAA
jgi:hypothetical protein